MNKLLKKILFAIIIIISVFLFCEIASAISTFTVQQGGTGVNTITGIIKGNGTSPFSAAVSGTDIKTVNGTSLLGSGNISISTSPGGSDTQVQFNDSSSFGGDAGFTYNKTSNSFALSNVAGTYITNFSPQDIFYGSGTLQDQNPFLSFDANDILFQYDSNPAATDTGGSISFSANNGGATSGTGGSISLTAGSAQGGNSNGGGFDITSGEGFGSGFGGAISLTASDGGATGAGGLIEITGGGGGATSGNGGGIDISSGSASTDGIGGDIVFQTGDGAGTNKASGGMTFNLGATTGGSPGVFRFGGSTASAYGVLNFESIASTDKTFTFPNRSGTFSVSGDTFTGDSTGTLNASGATALTLATVNANVGSFGSATQTGVFTVNGKGLITAASNTTITPAASSITGGAALTKTDDTNVTLTLGGSPLTSLLAASSLTLGWTGTLADSRLSTTTVSAASYGSATQTGTFTVGATGRLTAASNVTVTPAVGSITGLGTGVATALGVNVGSAGAFVTFNGALGTPSSGTVTNLTGTASININGTVGATTPAAGTFTTAIANSFVPNSSTVPSNGMYLPAANTLGWAINSAAEIQLTSTALSPAADGGSSFGTTALGWQNIFANTGFVLNIENGDWLATHTAGILTIGTGTLKITTPTNTTTSVVTIDGTQTLTNKSIAIGQITGLGTGVATWLATPSSANLASAITDETGSGKLVFDTSPTLTTGATISGTAPSLAFTDTTASAKSLTIAADANIADFRESAGASGSLVTLDLANNRFGLGTASPGWKFDLQSNGVDAANFQRSSSNSGGILMLLRKSRGTITAPSLVSAGDNAGNFLFQAYNDDWRSLANIGAYVDTGVGATGADMPGYLAFETTPDGSATQVERMRVTSAGNIAIGGTTSTEKLSITNGHYGQYGTADTVSSCGTSPSISGTGGIGQVTEGTIATGCVVTFGTAFQATPSCVVSSDSGLGLTFSKSTTALTITNVGALSGTTLDYHCLAHG